MNLSSSATDKIPSGYSVVSSILSIRTIVKTEIKDLFVLQYSLKHECFVQSGFNIQHSVDIILKFASFKIEITL